MSLLSPDLVSALTRRFLEAAVKAAQAADVPVERVHCSERILVAAFREADAELESWKRRGNGRVSTGKVLGAIAYWLSVMRPIILSVNDLNEQPGLDRFADLAVFIFLCEGLVGVTPAQTTGAQIVYLLATRRFTPDSLALLLDTMILMSGAANANGEAFLETIG